MCLPPRSCFFFRGSRYVASFCSLLLAHFVAHPVSLPVPLSAEFPTYFPTLHTFTHSFSVITFHSRILSKHTIFSVSHPFPSQNVAITKQTSYDGAIFRGFSVPTHLIQLVSELCWSLIMTYSFLISCVGAGKHLQSAGRGAPRTRTYKKQTKNTDLTNY